MLRTLSKARNRIDFNKFETMYKQIFIILFVVSSWYVSRAQDSTKYQFTESISFAQGFGGLRSKALIQAEKYYFQKDYISIIQLMYSESTADQLVGVILCKKMVEERKFVLSSLQFGKLKMIEQSDAKLSFNSGCTCQQVIFIKDYFAGENPCGFRDQMKWWLENLK